MYILRTPIASGANLVGKVYTIVELKQRGSVITDWPTFLKFLQWSAQLSLFLAFVDLFDWFCGRHWKFLSCFEIVTLTPFLEFWLVITENAFSCFFSNNQLTVAVWTQKTFFPLLIRPQGSQGCQKFTFFYLQMKVFSFCSKIAPKRHKLEKKHQNWRKNVKKPCFLRCFQIFFNFGAILAHQTSYGMFSGS